MRTLVFGSKGQLGRDLVLRFGQCGEVCGVDLPEVDITQDQAVRAVCEAFGPDWVINAAAYTDVEVAEDHPDEVLRVNGHGAGTIAAHAAALSVPVVYYSTDYVFDGAATTPYTPEDVPHALSVYGASKLAGEAATRAANARHFIVRTAWLYGPGGHNFVEKILLAAATRPVLRVVEDETGSPTHTWDLAEATEAVLRTRGYGTYHAVNAGACSRYQFACAIVRLSGLPAGVVPCGAAEFPMRARRPIYSALSTAKFEAHTGFVPRTWEAALEHYMARRQATP